MPPKNPTMIAGSAVVPVAVESNTQNMNNSNEKEGDGASAIVSVTSAIVPDPYVVKHKNIPKGIR